MARGSRNRPLQSAKFGSDGAKYRCMSCHLQKKPSDRPLAEFGITDRKRFYADFITQGCWTRCVFCEPAKKLPASAFRQESPNDATRNCIQCSEQFIGVQLQLNHHVCSGCRRELPENHWARTTMKMHLSYRKTPLICRECTAKGCTARDGNLYDCQACAQKLGCTHFDRHDLINRERPDRHKEGLICGCDTNSCSTMTTLKLVTLSFFNRQWHVLIRVESRLRPCCRLNILRSGALFMRHESIRRKE